MSEAKKCFKWLGIYSLLLAVNTLLIVNVIPDFFLLQDISSIYLVALSMCLVFRYYLKVSGEKELKYSMIGMALMILFLAMIRCMKYSVFGNTFFLGRYAWYLYYLPMLFIPMFMFYVSLNVYADKEKKTGKKWRWVSYVTCVLLLFVLTNDLHQQVFGFLPYFENWDSSYYHRWGYYLIVVWLMLLFAASVFILIMKSKVSEVRHWTWLIFIPFAVGVALLLLTITGDVPKINGGKIVLVPETFCFMAAGILECCMQLGLIPTNEMYRELMQKTSAAVQITDSAGKSIYKSESARELTEAQFYSSDGTRIGEHTVLRKMEIPGGIGFWQEDVSQLDALNDELEDAASRLSEETELIRLSNELKEKQTKINQRSSVYDEISMRTQSQSSAISNLAKVGMSIPDTSLRDNFRRRITLLGAYIKRCANMMLLSSQGEEISAGELAISVAEVLHYLNLYGIPGELIDGADGLIPAGCALMVFEAFDELLERSLGKLSGTFINLSVKEGKFVFKITLENVPDGIPDKLKEKLDKSGIDVSQETEDDTSYFSFTFPCGGDCR